MFEIKPIEVIKFDNKEIASSGFSSLNQFTKSYRTKLWKFKSRMNLCHSPEKGGFRAQRMVHSQHKLKRRMNKTMENLNFPGLYINNSKNQEKKVKVNDYGENPDISRNFQTRTTPETCLKKDQEVGNSKEDISQSLSDQEYTSRDLEPRVRPRLGLCSSQRRNIKIFIRNPVESV